MAVQMSPGNIGHGKYALCDESRLRHEISEIFTMKYLRSDFIYIYNEIPQIRI